MKSRIKSLKKLTLIIIIVITPNILWSQTNSFKLDNLASKTWVLQGLTNKTSSEKYSKTQITVFLNNKAYGNFEYYLSDTIPASFNADNVGKIKEGNYIVRRIIRDPDKTGNQEPRHFSVFEILKLDSSCLILRNIKHDHSLEFKLE